MTFALWCILAAGLLPYFCAGAAKFSGSGYDNAAPRASLDALSGWRRRADWAQRNHFESFPLFAAAVLTATWTQAPQGRVDALAGAYVAVRVAYSLVYMVGWPAIRSVCWLLGLVCVVLLFSAGVR